MGKRSADTLSKFTIVSIVHTVMSIFPRNNGMKKSMTDQNLSVTEIEAKIKEFCNRRDRYHVRGEVKNVYQAVHLKSSIGDYPLCHIRSISPSLEENPSLIDCIYCQRILKEQE